MIEGGKNFPSPKMIERIAAALGKDSADLFAITAIQRDWQETILADIGKLITSRLLALKNKPKQSKQPKQPKQPKR
jgi:hypothetical protein